MASFSSNNIEDMMDETFDQLFEQQFEQLCSHHDDRQQASRSKKKRAYIERQREQGHMQLWNDYFSESFSHVSSTF